MSVGWKHSLACAIHDGAPCSCKEDAAGPLAPLFAQVRGALDAESDGFCAWCQCSIYEQPHASECEGRRALAALSAIERYVQDMEKALRPFVEEYDFHAADYLAQRVDGEEARVFTARTVDLLIEHQRAARAALPAREKEEECPAGHGDQCCGYPAECREALKESR